MPSSPWPNAWDRPPLLPSSSSIRRVVVVGGHCLCPPLFFPGAMEWWLWFVYSPVQLHSHHGQKSLPRIETAQVLEQYNYTIIFLGGEGGGSHSTPLTLIVSLWRHGQCSWQENAYNTIRKWLAMIDGSVDTISSLIKNFWMSFG